MLFPNDLKDQTIEMTLKESSLLKITALSFLSQFYDRKKSYGNYQQHHLLFFLNPTEKSWNAS